MLNTLKIGLIINPVAGLGGRVALKGSDGVDIQQRALQLGAKPEAALRTQQALQPLLAYADNIAFYSVAGVMGGDLLTAMGFLSENCHTPADSQHTTEEDSHLAASKMQQRGVDLILFAGGDGTARTILKAVGDKQLCLGIPAGCKIYSAVFTVTPENTAELVQQIIEGDLIDMQTAQVLDINESSYREGLLDTRVYGEMLIPKNNRLVQNVKQSGGENEALVQQEIAAWLCEIMEPETLYIIGSGSSCKTLKDELGIEGTLLGVDAVLDGQCLLQDAQENQLLTLISQNQQLTVKLIITVIGGQGILLGRGNHQVCHQVIRQLGLKNLLVIASKNKIKALAGKPLGVDTGDPVLNQSLSGFIPVITGYDDSILYAVGTSNSL